MADPFEDLFPTEAPVSDVAELSSADALGSLLGISGRSVRDLASRGIIGKAGAGRYPVRESVRSYCAHLREQAAARSGSSTLTEERVRVAKEHADKLAMQNAIARGEMIAAREVESAWSTTLRGVRAELLALPVRIQQRLGHLTAHDVSEIDHEIRAALTEISE